MVTAVTFHITSISIPGRSDTSNQHSLTPWPPLSPRLLCSRVLTTPMHSSMALWPATFISCTVHRTPCLALFCLTQAQPAADSHIFTGSLYTQADSVQNCPTNQPPYLRNLLHIITCTNHRAVSAQPCIQNFLSILFCTKLPISLNVLCVFLLLQFGMNYLLTTRQVIQLV